MIHGATITDCYWRSEDGRVYSSASRGIVLDDDSGYIEWLAAANMPTPWPRDGDGEQSEAALAELLASYGLFFSPSAVETARTEKLSELNAACRASIIGGFRSDALGELHSYPSDINDQINLMGSVTDSMLPNPSENWQTPFWCRDELGWGWKMHSASQIQKAGRDGKAHVVKCQSVLQQLTLAAGASETVEQIDLITWPSAEELLSLEIRQ